MKGRNDVPSATMRDGRDGVLGSGGGVVNIVAIVTTVTERGQQNEYLKQKIFLSQNRCRLAQTGDRRREFEPLWLKMRCTNRRQNSGECGNADTAGADP